MKRRLVAGYVALTMVVLAMLAVPLAVVSARHERDIQAASLQHEASALVALVEESFEDPGAHDLVGLVQRYLANVPDNAAVFDVSGHVLVGFDPGRPAANVPAEDMTEALGGQKDSTTQSGGAGEVVIAVQPVVGGSGIRGVVLVAAPSSWADHRIATIWTTLALLALGVLVVSIVAGLALARSVTTPLAHLAGAVARFGHGDLTARAPGNSRLPEVRGLATEFNLMASQLVDLIDSQRRFVADASHQMRTPLTALRLRLETMDSELGGPRPRDIEAATTEVHRLSRLVDGLLALARAEGARPERQGVDLVAIIEDRVTAWQPLAEERGVELRSDLPASVEVPTGGRGLEPRTTAAGVSAPAGPGAADGLGGADNTGDLEGVAGSNGVRGSAGAGGLAVRAVPGDLEQVFDNLLANALEATPSGGTVSIVASGPVAGRIDVKVLDEGPGMSDDERAHAFDRFWQGARGATGSSGLGLAIVRQLVRASGGAIELRPAPGGGLEAAIALELYERDSDSRS